MILHTVMPLELVTEGLFGEPAPQREVTLQGHRLIVEDGPGGLSRIVRLISTDPAEYLDPRWTPGQAVRI